jgi:hypothetical protein
MRRITVTIDDGRRLEIGYAEPNGCVYEVRWHFVGGSLWPPLTKADARTIEAACLHDLIERRNAWRLALRMRREERSA